MKEQVLTMLSSSLYYVTLSDYTSDLWALNIGPDRPNPPMSCKKSLKSSSTPNQIQLYLSIFYFKLEYFS